MNHNMKKLNSVPIPGPNSEATPIKPGQRVLSKEYVESDKTNSEEEGPKKPVRMIRCTASPCEFAAETVDKAKEHWMIGFLYSAQFEPFRCLTVCEIVEKLTFRRKSTQNSLNSAILQQ